MDDNALSHGLARALFRQCFPLFVSKVFATVSPGAVYLPNWHIYAIAEYLAACERGEVRRLIINMPPRYLKSVVVNVAWPAFLLGHGPERRIISASYAQSLATKHAVDTRLVVQSAWYRAMFPAMRISGDQNEKDKFVSTARGHRIAVSVGSAVTGEGGDFLIVDDPLNPQQAYNRAMRERACEWFDHTFSTRLDDKRKGVIVVVMQRLHTEDLSGYLMERGGFEQLVLPAIAEEATVIGIGGWRMERKKGDVLHAAREDAAMLKDVQRDMGAQGFAAQYQQKPVSEEDGLILISWFKRF